MLFWLANGLFSRSTRQRAADDPYRGKQSIKSQTATSVVSAPTTQPAGPSTASGAHPPKSPSIPARYSQVYPSDKAFPDRKWHDAQTNNPLDRLEPLETLSEDWPEGRPVASGWYPRVRVVKTAFKSGMLRIEENVEIKAEGGTIAVVRSRIRTAADAKHVLVSSIHAADLSIKKIQFEIVKNPHYIKVPTESPWLVSSIPTLSAKLKSHGMREIETDSVVSACAQANDPVIGNGVAWHLENLGLLSGHRAGSDIGAPAAWDTRTDASTVLVAVIDSGIDSSDPELAPSIHAFPQETLGDGIDNDQNGYIDDALGYDFYYGDSNPADEAGHGTICAALIGATGNNGYGSSGVAWKASILNSKFLNEDGLGVLSDAIDAIDYSRNAGARILNLSWGYTGNEETTLLAAALGRCDAAGILMVCASGNSGSFAQVPAPASIDLPHLVAVAASTPADTLASFSVVDPIHVDLAAPGVDLPVSLHTNPWDPGAAVAYPSGTSFSAAIVSGSLALGLAEFTSEPPKHVIRKMLESVDPIPGAAGAVSSGGRLNLAKMLGNPAITVPHDRFDQRLAISESSGQWTGRNDGATVESMDVNIGLAPPPQRTTWFDWTASTDGLLRVSAKAIDGTKVRLAAFTSSNGLPASLLAQSSLGEVIEIPVVAGQKLFWVLDSASPVNQGLILTWQLPPTNDNWIAAKTANGLPLTLSGTSLGATSESFELTDPSYPWLPLGSVWWKWTPGVSETVFLTPSEGHLAFLQPLSQGRPSFDIFRNIDNLYSVHSGQSYAVLVVPVSKAAAGEFSVSIAAVGDIAIMQHPVNTLALAGETVTLEVVVAASTDPSFQWFRNGNAIPFANQSILRISPVLPQSFASYHVVVTTKNNTLQSQPAVVSPRYDKPRLISLTPGRSVVAGQSIDLNATFRSNAEMTYQWRKNGTLISGAGSTTLIINSPTTSDAGTYSITATNPAGSSVGTIQVNIFDTPWKGWVNRTPEMAGRGEIINVVMTGSIADAFTATEWLMSSDGGQNWSSNPLPTNFIARSCATDSSGTALVSGSQFSGYGLLTKGIWKKTPTSQWQKIDPVIIQPGGNNLPISELERLTFFDGKWWALIYSDFNYTAAHSTNSIHWTPIADPSNSTQLMRATQIFRFEDRLAIGYWRSSSDQTIQLQIPGGGTKILNFIDQDVRGLARIGDACYRNRFNTVLKIRDSQTDSTTIPTGFSFNPSEFFEGIQSGDLFSGLQSSTDTFKGKMIQGLHEKNLASKSIGFSCFAKSNNRWLVGYPDGRLWSGSDLKELPIWNPTFGDTLSNNKLTAYDNEFLFKKYHSSDGAKWQVLGAANNTSYTVRPLGNAGNTFLHSIRENGHLQPARRLMSVAMFPSALGPSHSGDFEGDIWSGENGLLNSYRGNSTSPKFVKLIKSQGPDLLITNSNLGANWSDVYSAKQIGGRWFLTTNDSVLTPRFIKTSVDGVNWVDTPLSVKCVIGRKNGDIIAIESSSRGYLSTDGVGWSPFNPQGLPSGVPTAIVAYREYYVAQFGQSLYASPDGITWAQGTTPLPVGYIRENRHTMLAVTDGGLIFQPGGETDSGPSLKLPDSLQAVTISRNQLFKYEVDAGDDDGDLAQVECLQDGVSIGSLTSAPFVFAVNSSSPGVQAIEFVARDLAGRISRVTSRLTVLNGGVAQSATVTMDFDLSKAVLFKDDYYRIYTDSLSGQKSVCIWESGNQWRPVSPHSYQPLAIVSNGQVLIASTIDGILTTADGLNWTHQGGFISPPSLGVKDGLIYLSENSNNWVSENGLNWSKVDIKSLENTIWADVDYGLSNGGLNGIRITADGGKNWITLDGFVTDTNAIPLPNGFIVRSYSRLYRILRGELRFTQIFPELDNLYVQKLDALIFVGKNGDFLKSSTDGINFTNHTHPPNFNRLTLRRFSGVWLSISSDMICATKDLKTWRTIIDFRSSTRDLQYLNSFNNLTVSPYGIDGDLLIENDYSLPDFILRSDFSMTQVPAVTSSKPIPDAQKGGFQFKNRTIAISNDWYFSRSNEDLDWERVALFPSEGFVSSYPHSWPIASGLSYAPTEIFAATDQKFVMLKKDSSSQALNYIITSDDGRLFKVHSWTGPVSLPEVTRLASSRDMFLASATNGRVLRSTDGLHWTVHQISPNLAIKSLIFYAGKWHAGGAQGLDNEIWTSTDGTTWTRSLRIASSSSSRDPVTRAAFVASGVARMNLGGSVWARSSDGSSWQLDVPLNQSIAANSFAPHAEHPLGIIGGDLYSIVIINEVTGSLVRRVNTGAARLRWLNGEPYLYSPGHFEKWTENDPRLTSISADSGVYGVGDNLEIRLSALELPSPTTRIHLFLSIDDKIGNDDDVILAAPAWSDGFALAGGLRRFTVSVPQSVTPGQFKIAAKFDFQVLERDLAIENNQISTVPNLIEIPGYQLSLSTNGQGNVNTSDPRILYPQGARVQLEAVPQNGYTFRGWEGSLVSTQSAILIIMDTDKQLSVDFKQGYRTVVRTIGNGTISGAPAVSVLLQGESMRLSQKAAQGWKFSGWSVNGLSHAGAVLSWQPTTESTIEGVFVPDFEAWRGRAFLNAPVGINQSWEADPDGDGLTNWQEILLSSSPYSRQSISQLVEYNRSRLRLVFTRPQGQVNSPWIRPESTDNLQQWNPADSVTMTERILASENGIETVEVTLPILPGAQSFFRLRMADQPPTP